MNLLEMTALPHVGPVLLSGGNPLVPESVFAAAALVTHVDKLVWSAPSASSAAAWLLTNAHIASTVDDEDELPLGCARRRDGWVSWYRGQHAKYSQVTASQCRPGVDRVRQQHAAEWLRQALNAIDELHFIPTVRIADLPAIAPEDRAVAAQHYGIGTTLVDWTFDPLAATFFGAYGARAGELASVFWISADYSRGDTRGTFFPPTFVERLWIQRGVFREHPCPEEVASVVHHFPGLIPDLQDRYEPSIYPRVEFEVTPEDLAAVAALERFWLGEGTDPVQALAKWAAQVANVAPPLHYLDAEYLFEQVKEMGLAPIPMPAHPLRENVMSTVDYLDSMTAQLCQGSLQYGLGPLYAFWNSTLSSLDVAWKMDTDSRDEFRSLDHTLAIPPNIDRDLEKHPELIDLIHAARSDPRVRLLASSSRGANTDAWWLAAGRDRPPSISFSEDEQVSAIEIAVRRSQAVARRLEI